MTRGIRIRLIIFAILAAVGLTYLGGSYLGFVDRILGRGYTVDVLLPTSGGLFEGSEVSYRGTKVGEVDKMTVKADGLLLKLRLEDDAKIPVDSPVFVHNLSAVGEQYLDFEPKSKQGPYLKEGDTVRGNADSVPLGEDVLISDLHALVSSLDQESVTTVVSELGTMFKGNAAPLRSMVDDMQLLIEAARQNEDATTSLIRSGQKVLQTQANNSDNIKAFSKDLSLLMGTLEKSDRDLRTVLADAPSAVSETQKLVNMLRIELPPLLDHIYPVNDMLNARLPALEQLLVTFPRLISAGPSALTKRGNDYFGRINLNLNQLPLACSDGYLPPGQWRQPDEVDFLPYYPAQCAAGPGVNMRGMKYAPAPIDWRAKYLGEK